MNDHSRENVLEEYRYSNSAPTWANAYLWPMLTRIIADSYDNEYSGKKAFEIGCGNGATANFLHEMGFKVTGIDPSGSGISIARKAFPDLNLSIGSAYDNLADQFGRHPLVISLEVIEHCFYPRRFARTFYDLIEPGGMGILSTPYHGYWKNLALAITGKWDSHLGPLWDGGHIKFFSERTLRALLNEVGFNQVRFCRVGRIPPLAKSLIAIVHKPE
ncbi:MAG: methyltransferase domain-containing protein [Gammaproteobacteria bacterium]|nr:methyltransferase domain-containing protein [Gammaproteobacteria bacterium]